MGKLNTAMRCFLCDRRRFADLFNGALFQGRPAIKPDDLSEASELYADLKGGLRDRTRDIKMSLRTGGALRILAVEHQANSDYTLPFRCMRYDSLEYGKQLQELKLHNKTRQLLHSPAERMCGLTAQDRLAPVYTLCLYHGEEVWDGPLSLREMMDFGKDHDSMSRFFANYPIFLFAVNEHSDFSMFNTELRDIFSAMNYRRNKEKLQEIVTESPFLRTADTDTMQVFSVLLNAPILWEKRKKYVINNNREEHDMCQAMKELLADARAFGKKEGITEGIRQGISQGISQGIARGATDKTRVVVTNMLARGMSEEDICALAECTPEFVKKCRAKKHR